jgi:(E)-4-hydroxy-3-methylbut-2-enyl-diphosphate synthase
MHPRILLSREVDLGTLKIGGRQPLSCQSMITAQTEDSEAAYREISELEEAGADLVRLTVPGLKAAASLESLRERMARAGICTPLVADIHFSPEAAILAADFVEKVRINPGNFSDRKRFEESEFTDEHYQRELERVAGLFTPLVEKCQRLGRVLRIGANHGSLSDRVMTRFGDTPRGMVESALEYARIAESLDFHDLVFSMKASSVRTAINAGRLLALEQLRRSEEEGLPVYPFHLGVTEAGEGEDARMKSFLGIGGLLRWGIGDTLRVSLTEEAVREIPVARELAAHFEEARTDAAPWTLQELVEALQGEKLPAARALEDPGHRHPVILSPVHWKPGVEDLRSTDWDESAPDHISTEERGGCSEVDKEDVLALCLGPGLDLLEGRSGGLRVLADSAESARERCRLAFSLLQNTRLRMNRADFITCPGCGRTHFELQEVSRKLRDRFAHRKGLKIGVMGCLVNGPGEMADADYGYVGAAPGRVDLYRGQECVEKNIPESEAVEKLEELINSREQTSDPRDTGQ